MTNTRGQKRGEHKRSDRRRGAQLIAFHQLFNIEPQCDETECGHDEHQQLRNSHPVWIEACRPIKHMIGLMIVAAPQRRSVSGANSQPLGIGSMQNKSKDDLTHLAHRAKQSTASIGAFQPALKGDKTPKGLGLKRKFESNFGNFESEKERHLKIFTDLQTKKPKLNQSRFNAVNEHIQKESRNDDDDDQSQAKSKGGRRSKGGNFRNQNRGKADVHRQQKFKSQMKRSKVTGRNSKTSAGGAGRNKKPAKGGRNSSGGRKGGVKAA